MPINLLISLIPKNKIKLWQIYSKFIDLGSRHFAFEDAKADVKVEKLRLLEKAIRRGYGPSFNILSHLFDEFKKENLSVTLLSDWLFVWRYTATLRPPYNERQISDIIGYIASPLARMIMALNNENPSIYLPFCSLVSAVLFIQMTEEKSPILKGSKWSLKQRRSKLKGWLKNSRILLQVIGLKKLKFKVALLLNRLKFYERAFQNNEQCKLDRLDEMLIILYSIWQFVTVRHKSVKIKGL